MKLLYVVCLSICLAGLVVGGCSDDKSTNPRNSSHDPLAGGGRFGSNDEYTGWNDSSGPGFPEPWPGSGLMTIFYSNVNCFDSPTERVIRDTVEWRRWLDSAQVCLPIIFPDTVRPMGDSGYMDTTVPGDSGRGSFGYINFDSSVVIVIGLAAATGNPPVLWIDSVVPTGGGTQVMYTVVQFDDDCMAANFGMDTSQPSSPIIAVIAPKPVDEPVSFARRDTVWSCWWEPDPHTPITLYYTDSPCDLGPDERLITDSATWLAWVAGAQACDSVRWWEMMADTGFVNSITVGYVMPVDFTTHAVIVLRAGMQTKWGGGIWLENLTTANGSTTVDYTVMQPGSDCPEVSYVDEANPTVAIRVPLPIGPDVSWNRRVETIGCDWADSSFSGGGM